MQVGIAATDCKQNSERDSQLWRKTHPGKKHAAGGECWHFLIGRHLSKLPLDYPCCQGMVTFRPLLYQFREVKIHWFCNGKRTCLLSGLVSFRSIYQTQHGLFFTTSKLSRLSRIPYSLASVGSEWGFLEFSLASLFWGLPWLIFVFYSIVVISTWYSILQTLECLFYQYPFFLSCIVLPFSPYPLVEQLLSYSVLLINQLGYSWTFHDIRRLPHEILVNM